MKEMSLGKATHLRRYLSRGMLNLVQACSRTSER